MDVILPRSRGENKESRSRSLPARITPIHSGGFEKDIGNIPLDSHQTIKSKSQSHKKEKILDRQTPNDEAFPESNLFYDWSHSKPDERGAELAEQARVWKVYVSETDKSDRELVEGWDKSLDVLLVFATLFSAISTAFLIESSKMLKQDPNDVAAAALLAISQTIAIIATNNSSSISPTVSSPDQNSPPDFVPPRTAVVVNTLWYMSLSLSIATAFLAMLAKDWCHSFISHRTGPPRDQAHRRQRKWKLIERWKMKKLIVGLPSLMHLTLLLFSVGLCVYLWDLNRATAIPVMCIIATFLAFYIWSSIVASVVEDFPYTTIVSQILRSDHLWIFFRAATTFRHLVINLLVVLYYAIAAASWTLAILLGLAFALSVIPFVLLDRLSFRLIVKTWKHVFKGFFDCAMAFLYPWGEAWEFLQRLYLGVSSYFSQIIQSLRLTEELTTSLTLSWLIQNCETPSAVDIALQAIAGASQRIPKEPLLSSQATVKIIQRLVSSSHNASDTERFRYSLYTRGLEFLDRSSGRSLSGNGDAIIGDVEVLVWELKSKNERKIAELVQDGSFRPSDDNLESMKIGNSAPSQYLWFLTGETRSTTESLKLITTLLSHHSELNDKQLHPAAVHSLANAAALHTSVSTVSELPPDLVSLCMKYCEKAIHERSDASTEVARGFGSAAVLTICALLHRRSARDEFLDETQTAADLYTRAWRAMCALIDVYMDTPMGGERLPEYVCCVGCLEILSHPAQYGLHDEADRWKALKQWCDTRVSNFVTKWGSLDYPLQRHKKRDRTVRAIFLTATSLVYDLLEESLSRDSALPHLPESIHIALTVIGCDVDEWQSPKCYELLTKFAFPELSDAYITGLEIPTKAYTETDTVMMAYEGVYSTTTEPRAQRQFGAAQIWLLLQLIGDSSSNDQQTIKALIERGLQAGRRIKNIGERLDQVEKEMEESIIQGYREEHRVGRQRVDTATQSRPTREKFTTGILGWRSAKGSQQSRRRSSAQLSRFEDTFEAGDDGRHSYEKYHRAYIARVIARILEKRGLQGDEDLVPLITADFKALPPYLQNLPPTLVPLPSSRATSRSSFGDNPTMITHGITGEHVSVEIRDPSGVSDAGGNVSNLNFAIPLNDSPQSL